VKRGDYLGQLVSELKGDDYITEYVSAGPKNYGYKTANGKVELKVKGFSLNCEGSDQLHYQLVRDNVISEIRQPLKVDKFMDQPEFDLLKGVESDLPLGVTPCSENEKIVPREHQYSAHISCLFMPEQDYDDVVPSYDITSLPVFINPLRAVHSSSYSLV